MKVILVPTDFSLASRNALNHALSLLKEIGMESTVLLLNTYLLPNSAPDKMVSIHDELRQESLKKLEEELQVVQKKNSSKKVSFEILSYMGSLENVIGHLAQERNIDYVVLGINGSPHRDEVMKILNRLHCPFLIVPFKKQNYSLSK